MKNLERDVDWRKLQAELAACARREAPREDTEGLASAALTKVVERTNRGTIVKDPRALAFKILRDQIATAFKKTATARGAKLMAAEEDTSLVEWVDDGLSFLSTGAQDDEDRPQAGSHLGAMLGRAPRGAGGRPKAVVLKTRDEVLLKISSEFELLWGIAPRDAMAMERKPLSEINEVPGPKRRAWLVEVLDNWLGDYAPWINAPGDRGGPHRQQKTRGQPAPAASSAQRVERARTDARRRARWETPRINKTSLAASAVEPTYHDLHGDTSLYLTDHELAVTSLLVGNWPKAVIMPASAEDVLSAEIEAIQAARKRHGVLRTADEKRAAGVSHASRRRPPKRGR
jgi:hypothetical protein